MKTLLHTYKNIFNYSGRASRNEYWLFGLYNLVIAFFCGSIFVGLSIFLIEDNLTINKTLVIYEFISYLHVILILMADCALIVRRLHDINRSGWWSLVQILPFFPEIQEIICGKKPFSSLIQSIIDPQSIDKVNVSISTPGTTC